MESEENESDTPENDRYHVVILHGESQTELAEAVCENIQNIDVGNSFQLVARTLDSIASPARTMMDIFNHVIENSSFLMFFRCAEFFEDMMNTFTVSAGLQDRIQHTDPKRHWTFIPVDIEKKVKIKGNPIINSLNGITISLSGDLGKNDERKLKKLLRSKLDVLNQSRKSGGSGFEVQEVIVQNQTRQVRDICKLVSSADQSANQQHVLHNYDNAQDSSTVTTSGNQDNSDNSTSDRSESKSHRPDTEQIVPPNIESVQQSFQTSQALGGNPQSFNILQERDDNLVESREHGGSQSSGLRESSRTESINTQPSISSPSNRWDKASNIASYHQFPSLRLPYSAETRAGQRGRSYEQGLQQQHLTHFPNPYGQQLFHYQPVHHQQQWQHISGIPRKDWCNMGARPKTRIAFAPMAVPPEAATRQCESAPVEGGGRQEDDTLFWGSGEEHARSCNSSLEGERGRNKRRIWKEEEGRERGGGGGGSGAVIAQRQTSTNSYSNPPNNQVPLSKVGKTSVPTPSSPYLPSSVGKGVDSEIDSNVPTIPGETLREGRQATTSGSQFASDNRKGEKGSIRGQGQPTGSAEEMRRDNGRSDTKVKGNNASPDSTKKASEEAQTVHPRESSHFPQEYPLSSRATLSPENSPQQKLRDADRTNSAACKEAELTMPTHAQWKGTLETSREEPPDSQRKQALYGGCLTEDTPKGILTQPSGPINYRRPGSSKDDTDIFGSFPELDDVMSEMSKCSLTPPSSPKFGNDRSNQSSLEYDCAPSYYSDQEENNGPAAASHRQQNQGPRDESPQRQQLQQPSHQQQERMLNQQQEAREQLPQPHQPYEQQYRQQEGEGFAELNGRSDRSRSSGDTDSGRGTI